MGAANLELTFDIRRNPAAVQAWWLDFPADYRASDPKEQPHRIVTRHRTDDTIAVDTYWPGPFGRSSLAREVLHVEGPGRWSADVDMMGIDIRDEFHAEPSPVGTRLRIRSRITPRTRLARLAFPLVRPMLLKSMRQTWLDASRICERDAPAGKA